ncbi:MAG TPA: carbohydrate kinase family protein [Opitutaceae bacterium]|nr:carbohydrate kinase family protein [Opitutaceae bacterium]
MRSGILAGGNWIRDHVKTIDAWPPEDGLANILKLEDGNGGGPYNVLKDLSKLGASFPLAGIGLIGDDADGRAILADCLECGIDTRQLRSFAGLRTSYTDVMTVHGTGRRTFFHERGANADLQPGHFNFKLSHSRILYLGYLMLLDSLDSQGLGGAPRSLEVLAAARASGMTTAVDCVSSASPEFKDTVRAVLPEVDILFTNDFEAEQISGISLGRAHSLQRRDAESAAQSLVELGVRQWAVVHFPEGACACSGSGEILWQASVSVPPERVLGSAGAGDALAAGILLGLHEGWTMDRALQLGSCAAASSLLHPTCSESVLPMEECLALGRSLGFSEFNWSH